MTITIGTCNTRGGDSRVSFITDMISRLKLDVLYLQEIHNMNPSNVKKIEEEAKVKCYITPGSQLARGVMTIVDPKTIKDTTLEAQDQCGNLLLIKGYVEGKQMDFLNIYAPNEEAARRKLLEKCNNIIRTQQDYIIFGGDFNCIYNYDMDSLNKSHQSFMKRNSDRENLRELEDDLHYVDTFRVTHPDKKSFTYTSPTNYRARLDRIYIHNIMQTKITRTVILPVSFSDHDLYYITLSSGNDRIKWGAGTYKYNKQIMEDKKNLTEIKQVWKSWRTLRHKFETILEWWDAGKRMLVKRNLIPMGIRMKQVANQEKRRTEIQLLAAHASLTNNAAEIIRLKNKLKEIEEKDMMGAALRTRTDWNEKGEKPTKFFFGLEKKKGNEKTITELKNDRGDIIRTKNDIMDYTLYYFKKKFTAETIEETIAETLVRSCEKRLDERENEDLNTPFSMDELTRVKKTMKNGKSPGPDGLSSEFYKQTWNFIGTDLLDVLNYVFLSGQMPLSMTQGIVTLIYKEKGDRLELNNWRPITLLNVDYKLMTSMVTLRLERVLPSLIHKDQGCAVKGRNIEDQLICIQDIREYMKNRHSSSMLCALDLEAAFDRADHTYLNKLFRHFNLGRRMENFMKTILSNMYSAIGVNGARTSFFKQSRSIRQGDPAAMACFIMYIEPLANLIRRDAQLTPILIPNQSAKVVSQYCDDTTVMVAKPEDYKRIQYLCEIFGKGTGAKLNDRKTEILLLGKWKRSDRMKLPQDNIKVNVKILGVWFGPDAEKLNQDHIIKKIDAVIDFWRDLPLSFDGKKLIIETKILTQLYHIIRVTGATQMLRKEVQKRITQFFWSPKKMCMIAFKTLQNSKENGGLQLPNLDIINCAILVERISKVLKDSSKPWKGQLIYRLGFTLRSIDQTYASSQHAHTFEQTEVTNTIATTYRALRETVLDWSNETFRTLKTRLHKDSEVKIHTKRDYTDTWNLIHDSVSNRKARDISYLVAHDALPIADVLVRRGMNIDNKCGLCGDTRETAKHLFINCTMIRELKEKLERELDKDRNRTLSEEEILYHEGRLKERKKLRGYVAYYKQTIWQSRALIYYGHISGQRKIKATMLSMYKSKTGT